MDGSELRVWPPSVVRRRRGVQRAGREKADRVPPGYPWGDQQRTEPVVNKNVGCGGKGF